MYCVLVGVGSLLYCCFFLKIYNYCPPLVTGYAIMSEALPVALQTLQVIGHEYYYSAHGEWYINAADLVARLEVDG